MKGIGFENVRSYVKSKHGDTGWAQVLAAMSAADRAALTSIVAVGWYEVSLFARLLRKVDQTLGKGDLTLLAKVGQYEAEQDFGRALRVIMRVVSPLQMFRAERRLWSHFQTSGEWVFTPVPDGMSGSLSGWAADTALCAELQGYLVRLIEFTGGKEAAVHHERCRARGHASCVYEFRWR